MPQQYIDEREQRRHYVRKRQVRVFALVAAVMVVALVLSILSWFHVFDAKASVSPEEEANHNFGAASVCAPFDDKGNAPAYLANSAVYLRVLNGTSSRGFAGAVGEALNERLFNVTSVTNYTRQNVKRTIIYYGASGIDDAYTVRANFTDAQMVMDDRGDALVDVVLGKTFNDLVPKKQVPAKGARIKNLSGCESFASVQKAVKDGKRKLPGAPVHDAPPAPQASDSNESN